MASFADLQRLIAQTSGDPEGAAIELLLLQMEPDAAKHLRLCAIPHQFDIAIFKLLDLSAASDQAENRFEEFSRLSLVVHRGDVLALHDQARRFLFGKWLAKNDLEFQTVNGRLAAHFEKSAKPVQSYEAAHARREKMFHTIGQDQPKGIKEFEEMFRMERANGRLGECEALLALVREYDAILKPACTGIVLYHKARLWYERRDWPQAERLFRVVLDNNSVPQSYHIKAWNRIGLLFAKQRDWPHAILNLESAERLARQTNDQQRICFALHDLGTVYRDSGEVERGRRLLRASIDLAEKIGNISCIAAGYNSLGTLERKAGDVRLAIDQYKKSLDYLSTLHDTLRMAQVYNNLGAAYADLSEWEAAREMYQKSIELKTEQGDVIGLARTLANLVPVYQRLERLEDATLAAEKATHIFQELRDSYAAAVAMRNLAKAYRAAEKQAESQTYYARAIELFDEAKDTEQAEATKKELEAYLHPVGMPWWIWVPVILILVVLLVFVIIVIIAVIRS